MSTSENRRKDYTGLKYNRLTFINYVKNDKWGKALWKCKCDCGNETIVNASSVTTGKTKSCGCLQLESRRITHTTHGMKKTRFYKIWLDMKSRCCNENDKRYINYGARGIEVCKEWLEKFENFRDDMYESYLEHLAKYGEKNTTIDRIDVNLGYCKENCRWSTLIEQANNKRNNVIVEMNDGSTITIKQYADLRHESYKMLLHRYYRSKYNGTKRVPENVLLKVKDNTEVND